MANSVEQLEPIKKAFESISFVISDITKLFKTTNAYTQLINASSDKAKEITLDSRERQFSSNRPIYLRYITFAGTKTKNIEISLITSDGKRKKFVTSENKPSLTISVWEFCNGFEIRSSSKLNRPALLSIQVFGFDTYNFPAFKAEISAFYSAKYSLDKLLNEASATALSCDEHLVEHTLQLEKVTKSLELTNDSLSKVDEDLKKQQNSLVTTEGKIGQAQEKLARLNGDEIKLKNNIQQLEAQNKTINKEIAEVREELNRLVNDKSLISDEFKDYITEGKSQSSIYIKVMILPITIIGLCAAFLFNGASDILFGHYETSQDKIAALALRIPFAAVLWGISYFCWDLAKKFLNKVFEVQSERLTLAKLLVIAKDTVFSTAEQVNATQDEKLHLRTRLKIEMLKAHLSKDIGDKVNLPEPPKNQ